MPDGSLSSEVERWWGGGVMAIIGWGITMGERREEEEEE